MENIIKKLEELQDEAERKINLVSDAVEVWGKFSDLIEKLEEIKEKQERI